jgi:hypothetical protein
LPNELPKQVAPPLLEPQVASVDTFFVGVEDGAADVRVDEDAGLVDDFKVVGVLPVQVPKAELQPVPQWAV